MAEAKIQKRNTYTIYDDEGIGTVQIADEVVAILPDLPQRKWTGEPPWPGILTNK